jgi:glycosyltransferase involved in cell wall biosynthesis
MIKVGLTELHGIAQEYSKNPPKGVEYSLADVDVSRSKHILKSPAKGVYGVVDSPSHDIIEAPLFPVLTKQPWIYTPAHFASAGSFDFFGIPTPRMLKMVFVKHILNKPNFKQLIFKSKHGMESLLEYGGISDGLIFDKMSFLYPVVAKVDDKNIVFKKEARNLLFVGEFLRKGGANVVDAFLALEKQYDDLFLKICAPREFQTSNKALQNYYLDIIDNHPRISLEFMPREQLLNIEFPKADIYLCPTYQESWGFSIQEAMAYGKPIIATNISAIPEMIEDGVNGILLDICNEKYILNSKGYTINEIDSNFKSRVTEALTFQLKRLLDDVELRERLGQAALETARTKFSPEERNAKILPIYNKALSI